MDRLLRPRIHPQRSRSRTGQPGQMPTPMLVRSQDSVWSKTVRDAFQLLSAKETTRAAQPDCEALHPTRIRSHQPRPWDRSPASPGPNQTGRCNVGDRHGAILAVVAMRTTPETAVDLRPPGALESAHRRFCDGAQTPSPNRGLSANAEISHSGLSTRTRTLQA